MKAIDVYLHVVYSAVCSIFRNQSTSALTGILTLDGRSSTLGAPILRITRLVIENSLRMKSIRIGMLSTGVPSKCAEQSRCVVTEVIKNSMTRSDEISISTIPNDNEAAVSLAGDLLTNLFCSVKCVVHTLGLCVNFEFTIRSRRPRRLLMSETVLPSRCA